MSVKESLKRARGDDLTRRLATDLDASLGELVRLVEDQNELIRGLRREVRRLQAEVARRMATAAVSPGRHETTNREKWAGEAHEGELMSHMSANESSGDGWTDRVARDWEELGFVPAEYRGRFIVDVGAGSRLRTSFFEGATLAAIGPLCDRFISEVDWQDLEEADELYSVPAEQFVPELEGRADFIVSINALDHGYDFVAAIRNLRRYAKPGALVFLSFDQHAKPDNLHPMVLNDAMARNIFAEAGFDVIRSTPRRRYDGGAGPRALNYWLRPHHTAV